MNKVLPQLWIAFMCSLMLSCAAPQKTAIIYPPTQEPITAQQAAQKMGKGFNLGQMFDNTQHSANLLSAKPKIDAYYAKGFRHVRIPITWTEKTAGVTLADPNTGKLDLHQAHLADILAVVDYALSLPDMFVIINAHHEKSLKDNNRYDVFEQLWQDIAQRFKERNGHLIYELLNEPHLSNNEAMPPENLRYMSELAYQKIRAIDPTRIIVIGGNQWFAAEEMVKTWPSLEQVGKGNDQYLMATFHHYDPWSFNGDNQGDYADNWTDENISKPMDVMLDWANTIGNGMPVYIGEWGTGWQSTLPIMQCNNIRLWYTKFASQYAAKRGMPTTVWDDGGWFGIFDHSSNTFSNNLVDCINGSCAWDGNERFNAGCY